MNEKLEKLYLECINELNSIGLIIDTKNINIKISTRSTKRYGCCKHENPDESSKKVTRRGYRRIITYKKFNTHTIEISKWLMDLDDKIIKNTIIHEIIHTFDNCNNHGIEFKKYANYINEKLGYNISRVGNKQEDYKVSGIEYKEKSEYKYIIKCKKCGQFFYRKRYNKNLTKKYRCGICGGKLEENIL